MLSNANTANVKLTARWVHTVSRNLPYLQFLPQTGNYLDAEKTQTACDANSANLYYKLLVYSYHCTLTEQPQTADRQS